ncbi:hypothetical protein MKW92_051878, partial [Papaver armeniacum]
MLASLKFPPTLPSNRFFCCHCTSSPRTEQPTIDVVKYKEAFAKRMAMVGLKPHHRIAVGVSGGPDSVALCVLTSQWKKDALIGIDEKDGFVDGLLSIVVDHGLRKESKDEANVVHDRVSKL